jgi:hypothetical protein
VRRIVVGGSLAVAVLVVAIFFRFAVRASRGGEESPLYSSRRYDPYGTAAFFELLRAQGRDVRALRRPYLDESLHGTLVQVLPQRGGRFPLAELRRWIADGNTVVQLTRGPSELWELCVGRGAGVHPDLFDGRTTEELQAQGKSPDELPTELESADWIGDVAAILPDSSGRLAPLLLRAPATWDVEESDRWQALARTADGVVAGVATFGRGRLIFVGAPTPALNATLMEDGNLEFLLAAVGDGTVLFDEWSHGLGNAGNVASLIREFGLAPLVLQTLFLLCLYVWSTSGWRLREQPAEARRRSSAEQIETLGYLYRRTLGAAAACRLVEVEMRRRLAAALQCTPAELERACRAPANPIGESARTILAAIAELGRQAPQDRSVRIEHELVKLLDSTHPLCRGEPCLEQRPADRPGGDVPKAASAKN